MESTATDQQHPHLTVVPTLHGPLALLVGGELLVVDQGSEEANREVARQALARFTALRR